MSGMDIAIFRCAKKRGWNPSKLTDSQYRRCALAVSDSKKKDISKALVSRTLTTLGIRTVPDEVASSNIKQCAKNICGSFGVLEGGEPVCHRCKCSGKFLESKTRDAVEYCPHIDPITREPKPLWDNRTVPMTVGRTVI